VDKAVEMSLDSEQLEAYRNDVFVARQHKSIFYGPPGYRIPARDEITIIGTGGVDTVDSCNRPQQGDFGVYIKEHGSNGTYRLAFVHPDSIPIDDPRGRNALKELDDLLVKSTNCGSPVFGLSTPFIADTKKTQAHITERRFSSTKTCEHFTKEWDSDNNVLHLDPELASFKLDDDVKERVTKMLVDLDVANFEGVCKYPVFPSFLSHMQVSSCLPCVLLLSHKGSAEYTRISYPYLGLINHHFNAVAPQMFKKDDR